MAFALPSHSKFLTVQNTNDQGEGSLRALIAQAEENDSIVFESHLKGSTIDFFSTIDIAKNIAIYGPGITLSGRNESRIFTLQGSIRLYGLTFASGYGNGGALFISDAGTSLSPVIKECVFRENVSEHYINCGGGAVYVYSGNPELNDCLFEKNAATYGDARGGAVFISQGSTRITGCTFRENESNYLAGAVFSYSPDTLSLSDCIFLRNHAEGGGGATCISSPHSYFNCTFEENTSGGGGGAAADGGHPFSFTQCRFKNNEATSAGAVLITITSSTEVPGLYSFLDCTFEENSAENNGGAISLGGYGSSVVSYVNCVFEGNSSQKEGGAIFQQHFSGAPVKETRVSTCIFRKNTSGDKGGAISFSSPFSKVLALEACTFEDNTATTWGGALCSYSQALSLSNCMFANNTAHDGGAVYSRKVNGAFTGKEIRKCTFYTNSAANGEAVYSDAEDLGFLGNLFAYNKNTANTDCKEVINGVSKGYNVHTAPANEVLTAETDFQYTGKRFLMAPPVGDYGGFTPTIPFNTYIEEWESVLKRVPVDLIPDLVMDQRGYPLPQTGTACAGSVEIQDGEEYGDPDDYSGLGTASQSEEITIDRTYAPDYILIRNAEGKSITVFSPDAKIRYSKPNISSEEYVPVSNLATGTYLIQIKSKSGTSEKVERFIKE